MNALVVDTSVAIKWFVPEVHSEAAVRVLDTGDTLIAPDLIVAEVGNTLWKKIGRGEISRDEGVQILAAFEGIGVELYPSAVLSHSALELACELQCTVYDALYLALAVARDCKVITADRRFYDAVVRSTWRDQALFVSDER
ncbi:MAG TPA: type II toxin-antitoxin system VapC family toxin [Thermoanaerobaculia bacterium]|jgi:predicted nucleic acid-binding protein